MIDCIVPSWNRDRAGKLIESLALAEGSHNRYHIIGSKGQPMLPTMASAINELPEDWGIAMHVHDDVEIGKSKAAWDTLTASAFNDPKVGLAGWGGALRLGHPDIYKTPYDLLQLGRDHYLSAMENWKDHGHLLTAPAEVAVLDGFCLCFRREAYEEMGGWRAAMDLGLVFHCYDLWACLMMRRLGWKVMTVPVPCRHLGGQTSTTPEYQEMVRSLGYEDDLDVHRKAHRILYDEFRDCLPVRIYELCG